MTDLIEDVGRITATWVDPTGTEWPLSDTSDTTGWFTTAGPSGWQATTYELVTDPLPRGGEQVRFVRSKPATITWPLHIFGNTHLQYNERSRAIRRAITMTVHRGLPGTLIVQRPDSTARSIEAYYSAGLEGEAGEGWLFSNHAVTLTAPDGYWRDVDPIVISREYTVGADFLSPFPTVSAGLTLGDSEIINPGDVDAWPEWTITGPMTSISAANLTSGYEFSLNYPLLAGEQITITTNRPTVRGPAGQNLVYALNWPTAYLWSLRPDSNTVTFNVSGGDVGTSVILSFNPRYEGA